MIHVAVAWSCCDIRRCGPRRCVRGAAWSLDRWWTRSPYLPAAVAVVPRVSARHAVRRHLASPRAGRCAELPAMVPRLATIRRLSGDAGTMPDLPSALVLNASFEPLSIVSSERATCLVIAEKAEVLEDDGRVIHSERLSVPSPSVIRLRYMVKVPYVRRAALSRRAIFARDDYRCQYCGERADSIDHVVPRSKGGPHSWENVAAACRPCNLGKRDRTPAEAGYAPGRVRAVRPGRPPGSWSPSAVCPTPGAPICHSHRDTIDVVPARPVTVRPRRTSTLDRAGPAAPRDLAARHHFTGARARIDARTTRSSTSMACRRAGVDVVRRRSGGGAVLLRPGEVTWIDVIVPAGTLAGPTDVHAPMVWLGQLLGRAFAASDSVPMPT